MAIAQLIMDGEDQIVVLPPEIQFPGTEVGVRRVGCAVVLIPKEADWDPSIEQVYNRLFGVLPSERTC